MPYKLNPQQFAAINRLAGPERYKHFAGRVTDWQEVWSLSSEGGWVMFGDDQGGMCFPVWPHPNYAAALATGEWAGYRPKVIPLDAFLERWLPGLDRDGHRVAVHPTPGGQGVAVEPLRLKEDLEQALE